MFILSFRLNALLIVFTSCTIIGVSGFDSVPSCRTTNSELLSIKSSRGHNRLIYSNFQNMNQLQLVCDIVSYRTEINLYSMDIVIDFGIMKIFNESLDLRNLTEVTWYPNVIMRNIEGFEVGMNGPIVIFDEGVDWTAENQIHITESKLDFYYKGLLIGDELCNRLIFEDINVQLFANMKNVTIFFQEQVHFRNPVCPYVFNNALIHGISFIGFEQNKLNRHLISFINLKTTNSSAFVNSLMVGEIYEIAINDHLINKFIFKSIKSLSLNGKLGEIHHDLFKSFEHLKKVDIVIDHAKNFFHSSTNVWLSSLHYYGIEFETAVAKFEFLVKNGDSYFEFYITDYASSYDYPEEDICLFKHFSFKKVIWFQLWREDNVYFDYHNDSCTYKFLTQNNAMIFQPANLTTIYQQQDELDTCNISNKLSLCSELNITIKKSFTRFKALSRLDFVYILKWAELIGPVITFPIVSAAGFLLNLLTILVIMSQGNKVEQLFDGKLFKYIILNSAFNCIECFIHLFKLVNICMGPDSVFCSSIISSYFAQYFAVYVTGFVGETMKSCSIITGLLFSLQRYIDTSQNKNPILKYISAVGIFKQTIGVIFLGSITSVIKIFNYSIGDLRLTSLDSPTAFMINSFQLKKFWYLSALYLFHYIFNDILLLTVNLIIDIKLVTVIKSDLLEKFRLKANLFEGDSTTRFLKFKNDLKYKKKVENKANSMIIASFVVYVICRLPELLGVLYFYNNSIFSVQAYYCAKELLCYLIDDSIDYLYMLSYSTNIMFYYKFNSFFQRGFRRFFGLKIKENR